MVLCWAVLEAQQWSFAPDGEPWETVHHTCLEILLPKYIEVMIGMNDVHHFLTNGVIWIYIVAEASEMLNSGIEYQL